MIETKDNGIEEIAYPNVETGKDVPLFVCRKCRPQWDTFDKATAKAHADNGIHNPELMRAR